MKGKSHSARAMLKLFAAPQHTSLAHVMSPQPQLKAETEFTTEPVFVVASAGPSHGGEARPLVERGSRTRQ